MTQLVFVSLSFDDVDAIHCVCECNMAKSYTIFLVEYVNHFVCVNIRHVIGTQVTFTLLQMAVERQRGTESLEIKDIFKLIDDNNSDNQR